jgi:hypothetical protein
MTAETHQNELSKVNDGRKPRVLESGQVGVFSKTKIGRKRDTGLVELLAEVDVEANWHKIRIDLSKSVPSPDGPSRHGTYTQSDLLAELVREFGPGTTVRGQPLGSQISALDIWRNVRAF